MNIQQQWTLERAQIFTMLTTGEIDTASLSQHAVNKEKKFYNKGIDYETAE